MPYDTELQRYISNLGLTVRNLNKLSNRLDTFGDALGTAGDVVDTIDDTGEAAGKIRKVIDDQLTVLKLTKQAGPLKAPSKIYEKLLKVMLPVVSEIEKAVDKLNGKKDTTEGGGRREGGIPRQARSPTRRCRNEAEDGRRGTRPEGL